MGVRAIHIMDGIAAVLILPVCMVMENGGYGVLRHRK
jgi:hypothetical protein